MFEENKRGGLNRIQSSVVCNVFATTFRVIPWFSSIFGYPNVKQALIGITQEISAVVLYLLFKDFLDKAIKENPENIFMFNFLEPAGSVICLQRSFEELVTTGIADVFISIALDENALLICVNKSLIIPQEVFKRLKELCFD